MTPPLNQALSRLCSDSVKPGDLPPSVAAADASPRRQQPPLLQPQRKSQPGAFDPDSAVAKAEAAAKAAGGRGGSMHGEMCASCLWIRC